MSPPNPPPDQSNVKRRTVVHIDAFDHIDGERIALCTVAGVALPRASARVPLRLMPGTMRHEADVGRVFFAYANLNAERPEDVGLERIERRWGETGPLHFDSRASDENQHGRDAHGA